MRNISLFLFGSVVFIACGDKDTEETPDTGIPEDTAIDTGDTEDTDETDTDETDTDDTDTDDTDTDDTDTDDTDTDDTDTDDTDTDDTDTDTEEPDPLDVDDDGDGQTENEGDCNDADDTIFSGAADDTQDGVDNDCDGDTDEDYVDAGNAVDSLSAGDLVITEVMQNPCTFDLNANTTGGACSVDDAFGEWFEVYNNTNMDIDLDGLMVTDEAGSNQDSFTVSGQLLIPAGGYITFGISADTTINGAVTVDYEYTDMSLGNGSDELMLHNATDVLDSLEWDNGTTFPDPTGASMSLDPGFTNATDNDDGANWCEGTSSIAVTIGTVNSDLGTPGMANDTCPPPAPPALSFAADVAPLMSQYACSACHGYLGAYSTVMSYTPGQASLALVASGDSAQSYLYHKIAGTHSSVGGSGSQMPLGSAPMTAVDIATVEQWINDGAQP
jgi:hypothetical protein